MIYSTAPSPLAIIPHGDFEKQVIRRLDDTLASGLIKQDTYQNLCNDLQWALPFQHEQFMEHLNDQIRNATPDLISNPNVRPKVASFTAEVAKTVHVTDDSNLCNTDNWWNDKFNSSAPIPTSSPSAPHTITPPTSVPAGIETPMTTKSSAHDHVYSNSIPCRDLPATSSLGQTDSNNMAQSTSTKSLDQRISHIDKIQRNLPRITIGEHVIFLPPISTTSGINMHKSLRFQDTEGSETHIENHIENQIAITKVMSLTNSAIKNPSPQLRNSATPQLRNSATTQLRNYATPNAPGCTLSVQQNTPTPISLPFTPNALGCTLSVQQGNNLIRCTSIQSENNYVIADSVVMSTSYRHIIRVSSSGFLLQNIIPVSGFQFPVQSIIQDSCFQFPVQSINHASCFQSSLSQFYHLKIFGYPLNIGTIPDIQPEPPPTI